MEFIHNDLGHLSAGQVVEVSIDHAANVRVMDDGNFHSYRRGSSHRYLGGYITQSRYRVAVPSAGRWHVAIDLGGRGGSIRSGVRVLG